MNKVVYAFLTAEDIPFYIGMGSIDRCRNHKKGSRNWRWWEMMKANKDYKFVIVDRSLTKQQAWDIEIDLIKEFGHQFEGGLLTNIHPGGSFYGDNVLKPVVQFDLKGYKIAEFAKMGDAAKVIIKTHPKFRGGNVCNCCKGRSKSVIGYQWFYKSEVGNLNFIGSIKRQKNTGGKTTSRNPVFDLKDMIAFKSKNAAANHMFPNVYNGSTSKGSCQQRSEFIDRFVPITKEEYHYLQELKPCNGTN